MRSGNGGTPVKLTDTSNVKKILITGESSFVGESFNRWMSQWSDNYSISILDMKNDAWKQTSFSGFDVVFHVAGIAHVSSDPKMKELYYKVNRDLAIIAAQKAKADSVKQFVFMSSIIVYGHSDGIDYNNVISADTVPKPTNFYADSKLQAEKGLESLQSDDFHVVILRPPMIYGKGSKGNYPKLVMIARYLPVFPDMDNQRSMLHINNLCEFVRLMVKNNEHGIFYPQNTEYCNTSEMVRLIAKAHGRNIMMTKIFNPLLVVLSKRINIINKVFGSLIYDKKMSVYKENYCVVGFEESIQLTENG